jgi:basic amino acid/polyamine antiporter, APA family
MNSHDRGGPAEEGSLARRLRSQDPDRNGSGSLGLWSVISIIIGIVIGATIFRLPWLVFLNTNDPWSAVSVWALGGLFALVGAFCYAELATTYPRSGGDYVYLTRAFGPWCGFLFGWSQLTVTLPASIGFMAFVFADFATEIYALPDFTGWNLSSQFVYAFGAVVILSLLNIIGVTFGKTVQNVLAIGKIVGLLAIVVAGFGWAESSPVEWQRPDTETFGWAALAMILVMYAYGGWNDAAFVAAEVRNPRRNIPLALLLGVGIITVLYVLVNAAYIVGLGFHGVQQGGGELLATRLLDKAFGDFGAKAISIIVIVSALGAANGLIFAGSRVYATLGNDHPLFTWLGHWRPGFGTPILALIVQALVSLGMIYIFGTVDGQHIINQGITMLNQGLDSIGIRGDIGITAPENWTASKALDALLTYTAPVFWAFFLATGFSLFTLRTRDAGLPRPFPVPLYPIVPFIFCCVCIYMLFQSTVYIGFQAAFAIVLVLIGLPLYGLSRLIGYHGLAEAD